MNSILTRTLAQHHLHIYYGFAHELKLNRLEEMLGEEERNRITKLRSQSDRNLHLASRAFLKQLLASYLRVEIDQVQIETGIHGKPSVKGLSEIQFNISHSWDIFTLAFVRDSRVGIDVENLNRIVDKKSITTFLFSENELKMFNSTDERFHQEQLINAWTRKEAFVKACGTGLSFPLKQLEVSFLPAKHAEVLSTKWCEDERLDWHLESIDFQNNYKGAVAVQGKIEAVEVRNIASIC